MKDKSPLNSERAHDFGGNETPSTSGLSICKMPREERLLANAGESRSQFAMPREDF